MSDDWVSKLKKIKSSGAYGLRGSDRISSNPDGALLLDGEEIPYEHIPLAFKCLSSKKITYNESSSSRKATYLIETGLGEKFAYHLFQNEDFELTFGDLLHCSSGPARRRNSTSEHYKHGALHNADGPAVTDGSRSAYFLNGREVSLLSFIERSPRSHHSWGSRGDSTFTISKLNGMAVVRGLDGTVALLSAKPGLHNIDDLILDIIATRIPGYRVVAYEHIGSAISPLYTYLQSDTADWVIESVSNETRAGYISPDGSRGKLLFNKSQNQLNLVLEMPNSYCYTEKVDFSFDPLVKFEESTTRFPNIKIHRNLEGRIHHDLEPAVILPSSRNFAQTFEGYFINGTQVSSAEHSKYNVISKTIVFTDSKGNYHRVDGPAIIDFPPYGMPNKYWYEDGQMIDEPLSDKTAKLINSTEEAMPTYVDLNAKQDQRQNKFEEALKRVAKRSSEVKEPGILRGDKMDTKTVKHGGASASPTDSRIKQVTSGAKLGLQKAALRVGSQKVAEKVVETASPTDNIVVQRIVQLAILLGSAELAERLPDAAASKIGLTEERREGFGGLARYVAGETLGRDAVEIASFVAPMLLDKLQGISAEEIAELTSDAEEVERLEAQVAATK